MEIPEAGAPLLTLVKRMAQSDEISAGLRQIHVLLDAIRVDGTWPTLQPCECRKEARHALMLQRLELRRRRVGAFATVSCLHENPNGSNTMLTQNYGCSWTRKDRLQR